MFCVVAGNAAYSEMLSRSSVKRHATAAGSKAASWRHVSQPSSREQEKNQYVSRWWLGVQGSVRQGARQQQFCPGERRPRAVQTGKARAQCAAESGAVCRRKKITSGGGQRRRRL